MTGMWRTIRRALMILGLGLYVGGLVSLTGWHDLDLGKWYFNIRPGGFVINYIARTPPRVAPSVSHHINLFAIGTAYEFGNTGFAINVYGRWFWLGSLCLVPTAVHHVLRFRRRGAPGGAFPIDPATVGPQR
jgi:hypothetical protein